MKVLVVTNMYPSPERPHSGTFVRSQVESLQGLGVEVCLYVIEGWRRTAEYARAFRELPAVARTAGVDLVHAHYGLSGFAALRVGPPLVVSFCGDDVLGTPGANGRTTLRSRLLRQLSHVAARRADAVIVKSEEMRGRVRGARSIDVIPNGVDLELFVPMPRAEARARLGWPDDDEAVLLFAGQPEEPVKNWPLVRDVAERLERGGRRARLVTLTGRPQDEVVTAMNASDVLLLPSYHEGSPNVVKEAMAVGLPVVAARVGDCAERLRGCHPSAVVERTVPAFVRAVGDVLDAGTRSNGRELVAPLELSAVAQRVLGVYEHALAGQRDGIAASPKVRET
jgi:glycosyltransferase involved in cell wall biosynthesis